MARPQKVIQRRANGQYFVRLQVPNEKDPKKPLRLTRSLETKDAVVAAQRAAQAIQELRQQARLQEQGMTKWRDPEVFSQLVASVGGDVDVDDVIRHAGFSTKQKGSHPSEGPDAGDYLNPEAQALADALVAGEVPMTWQDLVREAVRVRKRVEGTDYSDSWYIDKRIAINECPFTLQEATPALIRAWGERIEESGLHSDKKLGALQNLMEISIKSGLLDGWDNPFKRVSFHRKQHTAVNIYTALEQDYRALPAALAVAERRVRLAILLNVYCGVRCSEVTMRKPEDFDLEQGTLTVPTGKGKNKTSERTIPIPAFLVEELKDWGFSEKWAVNNTVNKTLYRINCPEGEKKGPVTSHSWRHGLTRLAREFPQVDKDCIEDFLGHKLDAMKSTYGNGYSLDSMRLNLEPVWARIDELLGIN